MCDVDSKCQAYFGRPSFDNEDPVAHPHSLNSEEREFSSRNSCIQVHGGCPKRSDPVTDRAHTDRRVVRRPRDDPSIFAIELETLARRAFIDISIQLQMVRDRFIDGQWECALRIHLDSLGPDTPMADIVDCCRVWESHCDEQIPTASPETETLEDLI